MTSKAKVSKKGSKVATVEGSASVEASVGQSDAFIVTRDALLTAYDRANQSYIAREQANGRAPVLNAKGAQRDIAQGRATVAKMTDGQIASLSALGMTEETMRLLESMPVKVAKRLPGVFMFHATKLGQWAMLARTFVLLTCGLVTGVVTRDGLVFAATGKGNESTSDEVPSIKRARENMRALGRVGVATFATQYSSAYGENGIGRLFGISTGHARNVAPVIDASAPVVQSIIESVAALTGHDLADMRAKLEKGEANA